MEDKNLRLLIEDVIIDNMSVLTRDAIRENNLRWEERVLSWSPKDLKLQQAIIKDSRDVAETTSKKMKQHTNIDQMLTIQEVVQEYVDDMAKILYKDHNTECVPQFFVSILDNNLLLSVVHAGLSFSEVVFPDNNMTYGLEPLSDVMERLFNRTM